MNNQENITSFRSKTVYCRKLNRNLKTHVKESDEMLKVA